MWRSMACVGLWLVEALGLWRSMACGGPWLVEACGLWRPLACGGPWLVEACDLWRSLACGGPWLLEALACGGPYTVLWVSETFVVCCFSRVHCTGQRSTATRRSMDHSVLNCCLPRMLTLTSPSASSSSAIMAGSVTTGITDFFWSKTLLSHVFCLIFTSLCQAWILA